MSNGFISDKGTIIGSDNSGNAIGYEETVGTACKNPNGYTVGSYFKGIDGNFYEVTATISSGATITVGTNCKQTSIATELSELNAEIVNAGSVRYYNGEIQYTPDGGTTWVNLINTSTPNQLLPVMTGPTSPIGTASIEGSSISGTAYKCIDGSGSASDAVSAGANGDALVFMFTNGTFVKSVSIYVAIQSGYTADSEVSLEYTTDGLSWFVATTATVSSNNWSQITGNINATVLGIRARKSLQASRFQMYKFEAWN